MNLANAVMGHPRFLPRRIILLFSVVVALLIFMEVDLWQDHEQLDPGTAGLANLQEPKFSQSPKSEPAHPAEERAKYGNQPITDDDVTDQNQILKERRLPSCIIIGVRKGGTRALLEMLALHPQVSIAPQEVHFFDNETKYSHGYNWYLKQFPPILPGQMSIEKSPSYFVTAGVAERIKKMNPDIKLLLIVREPVTRLISDFTQIAFNRMEKGLSVRSFDETFMTKDGNLILNNYGVETGIYHIHLERWYQHFNRSQIYVTNGDKLTRMPWKELRAVENFLQLPNRINQENFTFNKSKGFHCLMIDGEEKCLPKSKGRQHVNVSSQLLTKLRQFYRPHNYRFYNLVGKDFGWPEE